jgi:putative restriction endonuclease
VLPVSKTHHAAFDRDLFTINKDHRLRVDPDFETESDVLQRTTVEQYGERIAVPDGSLDPAYVQHHNSTIE